MAASTPVTIWESLQTQGTPVAKGIPFIDPDTLQPTIDVAGIFYDPTTQEQYSKKPATSATLTPAATVGAQTINKAAGSVNFAAAAQSLIVTNSFVEVDSLVFAQVEGADATATSVRVTRATGSFTLTLNAAATAETRVAFYVVRKGD